MADDIERGSLSFLSAKCQCKWQDLSPDLIEMTMCRHTQFSQDNISRIIRPRYSMPSLTTEVLLERPHPMPVPSSSLPLG
jgi:hypothetical protein